MKVRFREDRLLRCYREQKEAIKEWNPKVARAYVRLVNILYGSASASDLTTLRHLRFHPLKGKLEGRYALNLDGFWRLIVSFDDRSMREVCIEEVSKHYDD